MLTISLGKIIDNNAPSMAFRPGIYVIRENDTVLYVGKSERSVGQRIQEHCKPRRFSGALDALGAFVRDTMPNSLELDVDILSVAECNTIVMARAKTEKEIEPLMIRHFRPILNGTFNSK